MNVTHVVIIVCLPLQRIKTRLLIEFHHASNDSMTILSEADQEPRVGDQATELK